MDEPAFRWEFRDKIELVDRFQLPVKFVLWFSEFSNEGIKDNQINVLQKRFGSRNATLEGLIDLTTVDCTQQPFETLEIEHLQFQIMLNDNTEKKFTWLFYNSFGLYPRDSECNSF